jgi:hypothetical protein
MMSADSDSDSNSGEGSMARKQNRRSRLFYFWSRVLANLYVVVLEFGRLYGHILRKDFWMICKRFDWHCGRLTNAPRNFRKREAYKFALFWVFWRMTLVVVSGWKVVSVVSILGR